MPADPGCERIQVAYVFAQGAKAPVEIRQALRPGDQDAPRRSTEVTAGQPEPAPPVRSIRGGVDSVLVLPGGVCVITVDEAQIGACGLTDLREPPGVACGALRLLES